MMSILEQLLQCSDLNFSCFVTRLELLAVLLVF